MQSMRCCCVGWQQAGGRESAVVSSWAVAVLEGNVMVTGGYGVRGGVDIGQTLLLPLNYPKLACAACACAPVSLPGQVFRR